MAIKRIKARKPQYERKNNANDYSTGVRLQKPEYRRALNARIKEEVFGHYSPGEIRCACCKEKEITFLCIDHLNGGGNEHRRSLNGVSGANLWRWLKKSGYPTGFQILCHNCNFAKSHTLQKRCPHLRNIKTY